MRKTGLSAQGGGGKFSPQMPGKLRADVDWEQGWEWWGVVGRRVPIPWGGTECPHGAP